MFFIKWLLIRCVHTVQSKILFKGSELVLNYLIQYVFIYLFTLYTVYLRLTVQPQNANKL